jgi:hypothetical protein
MVWRRRGHLRACCDDPWRHPAKCSTLSKKAVLKKTPILEQTKCFSIFGLSGECSRGPAVVENLEKFLAGWNHPLFAAGVFSTGPRA